MPATDLLSISNLLAPEVICVGLDVASKDEAIDRLVDLLDGHEAVADLDQVRADVHARERQMSTGVGKSLALPHARTSAVTSTVAAFATTAKPLDFDAIDGEPVRLVFLLVGPDGERGRHIRLLSRISRLMNRDAFRAALLEAESPEAVLGFFRHAEDTIAA